MLSVTLNTLLAPSTQDKAQIPGLPGQLQVPRYLLSNGHLLAALEKFA